MKKLCTSFFVAVFAVSYSGLAKAATCAGAAVIAQAVGGNITMAQIDDGTGSGACRAEVQDPAVIAAINAGVGTGGGSLPTSIIYVGMNVGGVFTGMTGTANGLKVDGSAVTQPVSAASLPLPAGAATAARQDTGNASLATIATLAGQPVGPAFTLPVNGVGATMQITSTANKTLYAMCAHVSPTGTAGWVFAYNSTSAPSNGSITYGNAAGQAMWGFQVGVSQSACWNWNPGPGIVFSQGIYLAYSTTGPSTLTLATGTAATSTLLSANFQ